jgi:hypothetical protein
MTGYDRCAEYTGYYLVTPCNCPRQISIVSCTAIHTLGVETTSKSCHDLGPAHSLQLGTAGLFPGMKNVRLKVAVREAKRVERQHSRLFANSTSSMVACNFEVD